MGAGSDESPGRPVSSATTHRAMDDEPPARKFSRAVTYASSDVSSPLRSPAGIPIAQYQAPPAPVLCPFPLNRRRPLSLSLPHFATLGAAPDNVQSRSVATQLFPPFPEDWSSTPCVDLADFDSDCSWGALSSSAVPVVAPVVLVD